MPYNPIARIDASGYGDVSIAVEENFDDDTEVGPSEDECIGGGGFSSGNPQSFAGQPTTPGTSVSTKFNPSSAPHTPNQKALLDLAKHAHKTGKLDLSNAETLMRWSQEYNFNFRLDFGHPGRSGYISQIWHIHIGPLNHLPITPITLID